MREQLHEDGPRTPAPVLSPAELWLLDQYPDMLARLDAATDDAYPHRLRHIQRCALVILKAQGKAC